MNRLDRIVTVITACVCSAITGLCVAGYLNNRHYLFAVTGVCFTIFTVGLIAALLSSDDKDPEDPLG